MAGTPEKLIERIADDSEKGKIVIMSHTSMNKFAKLLSYPDNTYLDTLLLTFRSFMKPGEFLQHLIDRYNCVLPENPTTEDIKYFVEMKEPTQQRYNNPLDQKKKNVGAIFY
jgi:hypothetical protein